MDYQNDNSLSQGYDGLYGLPPAMAYVPWQKFERVLDAEKGLRHGTIFTELVLPFWGDKAACSGMGGAYE